MFDVAIIGSGMGGSTTAIMLAKLGYRVALLEKGMLPRFALGESTTPLLSKKIRHLGKTYNIPEFESMATYESIKASGLPFTCGPKELFHYFWQEPGQVEAEPDGINREIIVQTPEVDTQLLRAESDKYLVDVAVSYGVDYRDQTNIVDIIFSEEKVTLECNCDLRGHYFLDAKFIIDASGFKSLISQKLGLSVPEDQLEIPLRSRCIFTHFKDIESFESTSHASPEFINKTPAGRERATQHHCFDGGWVWLIPFADGVTSVGLNLDMDVFGNNSFSAEEEFWEIISRFPIIHKMLKGKEQLFPLIKTGRLQHRTKMAAGDRWAMLPGAAVGSDAWFSTGLAFTLICAHRLVDNLHNHIFAHDEFTKASWKKYEETLFNEWKTCCTMVNGIYKSLRHFELFKYYCFFCFMGAETFVARGGIARPHDPECQLLNAGDRHFMEKFNQFYEMVLQLSTCEKIDSTTLDYMQNFIRQEMKNYNFRDYGNPIYNGVHKRVPMKMWDAPKEAPEVLARSYTVA